jgi:uncharacterized protein (TIGR03435 family)
MSRSRVTAGTGALLFATLASSAPLQDPEISYVASVKLNTAIDARGLSEYLPGGRLRAIAVTPQTLVRLAYRVLDYQIVDAPPWFSSRRYDIEAKAEGNPPPSQQALIQALLRDRFSLAAHRETRDSRRFALVLARRDGTLGPQLIRSDFDCAAYMASPHAPPEPGKAPTCGARVNAGNLSARAIPISQLAASLTGFLYGFTIDKTGLAGGFDVELTWTPDTPPSDGIQLNPGDASIFAALQEQLGLKVVTERGPVEMLVVTRVEEPSGN